MFFFPFNQAQDDPTWKKAEIELKLLTLMQPLIFPGKFERSFSATDYNKKKASRLQGSEKTDTIRSECCSVIVVFELKILLQ